MKRLPEAEAAAELAWLADRPIEEGLTGYAPDGWAAQTWILHSMYEHIALRGLGDHDEWHRRLVEAGDVAPLVIGDVDVDEATVETGIPLGFVVRPSGEWKRLMWADYLARFPDSVARRDVPPCFRWFPRGSWPLAIGAPPEGSMDAESFESLLRVLCEAGGLDAECVSFYASGPARDFDALHVWKGRLADIPLLLEENGGPYGSTPTNFWSADRSWFVWTDWDLQGTRLSGDRRIVGAIEQDAVLETISWP